MTQYYSLPSTAEYTILIHCGYTQQAAVTVTCGMATGGTPRYGTASTDSTASCNDAARPIGADSDAAQGPEGTEAPLQHCAPAGLSRQAQLWLRTHSHKVHVPHLPTIRPGYISLLRHCAQHCHRGHQLSLHPGRLVRQNWLSRLVVSKLWLSCQAEAVCFRLQLLSC